MANLVKKDLIFWARINAAGIAGAIDFAEQLGPAALTGFVGAHSYQILLPAGWQIPVANRLVVVTPIGNAGAYVLVDHAAAAITQVIVLGWTAAGGGAAVDCGFYLEIYKILKT